MWHSIACSVKGTCGSGHTGEQPEAQVKLGAPTWCAVQARGPMACAGVACGACRYDYLEVGLSWPNTVVST